MSFEHLLWEGPEQDGVAVLTFNRPEKRNAFNDQTRQELGDLMITLRAPHDIGAIVVTGAGESFCAGGDFSMLERFSTDVDHASPHGSWGAVHPGLAPDPPACHRRRQWPRRRSRCDLCPFVRHRRMSETAVIADTHVRAGIVAGDGGTLIWPALLGPNLAKEYLMTGDHVDAPTALRLGLANHVVARDEVMTKSLEIARRLARGPRHAIAWTKQGVNVSLLREASWMLTMTNAQEARSMADADLAGGPGVPGATRASLAERPQVLAGQSLS